MPLLTTLLCCCFSPSPTSADEKQASRSLPNSSSSRTMPRKHPTTAEAEAYVPSWERRRAPSTSSSTTLSPDAPRATGLRARGASMSSCGAAPSPDGRQRRPSSASHLPPQPVNESAGTGNSMLYFGNGITPQHAMRTYTAGSPNGSGGGGSSSTAGGRSGGGKVGGGNASGRDASGYAPSGVSGTHSGMDGMYSSLTYGGSLQYNFSGTQSYGAGTVGGGGGLGGGLM